MLCVCVSFLHVMGLAWCAVLCPLFPCISLYSVTSLERRGEVVWELDSNVRVSYNAYFHIHIVDFSYQTLWNRRDYLDKNVFNSELIKLFCEHFTKHCIDCQDEICITSPIYPRWSLDKFGDTPCFIKLGYIKLFKLMINYHYQSANI